MVNYPVRGGGEKFWSPFSRVYARERKIQRLQPPIPLSRNCALVKARFGKTVRPGGKILEAIDTPRSFPPPYSGFSGTTTTCNSSVSPANRGDVSFRWVMVRDEGGNERFLPRLRVFGVINKIVTRRQETNFTDRVGRTRVGEGSSSWPLLLRLSYW